MRIYDGRIGKFLSVDPISFKYPMLTPYQFASNKPIVAIDLDGAEAFIKNIQHNNSGKVISVDLQYDESIKALSESQIYVQHSYPNTKSIMKFESLGPLDFSNKKYGYKNGRGFTKFTVRSEESPMYNTSGENKSTLFSEFSSGRGAENSVIIGGRMLDEIKSMPSVKEKIQEGIRTIMQDGKIEVGEHVFEGYKMTYKEGAKDIWISTWIKGFKNSIDTWGSAQHFLGSYILSIDVLEDGKTGLFTLSDWKSIESLTDHQVKGNSHDRSVGKIVPWGSTYQRYIWTGPINQEKEKKEKKDLRSK
jgi:hypothetical protein